MGICHDWIYKEFMEEMNFPIAYLGRIEHQLSLLISSICDS